MLAHAQCQFRCCTFLVRRGGQLAAPDRRRHLTPRPSSPLGTPGRKTTAAGSPSSPRETAQAKPRPYPPTRRQPCPIHRASRQPPFRVTGSARHLPAQKPSTTAEPPCRGRPGARDAYAYDDGAGHMHPHHGGVRALAVSPGAPCSRARRRRGARACVRDRPWLTWTSWRRGSWSRAPPLLLLSGR